MNVSILPEASAAHALKGLSLKTLKGRLAEISMNVTTTMADAVTLVSTTLGAFTVSAQVVTG